MVVTRAGFLTTIQDRGRKGFRQVGVSLGGALDNQAIRVANLLVGNDESAAVIEITFGRLRLRASDERLVAWCGGEFDVHVGAVALPAGHPAVIRPSEELIFDHPKIGCRSWLAISGGLDMPSVLGCRSTDLRASFGGFNGRPLRDHDEVPLGANPQAAQTLITKLRDQTVARWKPPHDWSSPAKDSPVLRFIRGAHWDRFDTAMTRRFTSEAFAVSPDSDRMGVRFESPELLRKDDVDLVSEAVAPGTVQVPPSGKPILLLGDCQTIGGYPKIAHVITVDLPLAAQLRAGDKVRFEEVSLPTAHKLLLEREQNLEQFRRGLEAHFA